MPGQKKTVTEEKERRVIAALTKAVENGSDITIRGVARAAGVDHVFIQRRPDLRQAIQACERRSETPRERAGMNREAVRRLHSGATLSDRERAIIDEARGATPMGRYAREALMEKAARDRGCSVEDLEKLDTARRPAPRRNRERQQREEGQP